MHKSQSYNTPQHFDSLFRILSSDRFLNKEGLGGELPFFIHSYPVVQTKEVNFNVQSLVKRLTNSGVRVIEINLYELCLDILKSEGHYDTIISQEAKIATPKDVAFYLAETTIALLWLDFLKSNGNNERYVNTLNYWIKYKMVEANLYAAEELEMY